MRERGSNTARPTEKGGGGSPDWVAIRSIRSISARRVVPIRSVSARRFGRVLSVSSCRVVPIGSCRVAIRRAGPVGFVAIRSIRSVSARRVVPIRSVSARRDSACRACLPTPKSRRKHKKKPDSSIVESGCSYRKASRALNLPLAPLSNTRASARSVLLGLARRSCNVMITSDLRHIVHYTLQNMRTREQS